MKRVEIRTGEDVAYVDDEARWAAVERKDLGALGHFFFAVATTGVYCRPGCPARLPKRENTRFFASQAAVERAGFRACRRCHPNQSRSRDRHSEIIAKVCRKIEQAEETPALAELARDVGLSPYYLHRLFKRLTGVTPRGYAADRRWRRVKRGLRSEATVTAAIYSAGFQASSRFYENSGAMLGMTPTEHRQGGGGTRIRYSIVRCSLGFLLVAATDKGFCAIRFGESAKTLATELRRDYPLAKTAPGDSLFTAGVHSVVELVERGLPPGRALPLDIRGTAFQRRVWEELQRIPAGETASYGDIAERMGDAGAARAVARACVANPLAVLIPCHRVVRKDGSLGGYRWGIGRKQKLLERE